MSKHDIHAGQFYQREGDGPLTPAAPGAPDVWVCRRVADYPRHLPPPGAQVSVCTTCGVMIAFNPARTVDARKVCMQCAGIQPLPFPE